MKISHIEHLGIAVKSIEEALPYYENVLGLKCYNIEAKKSALSTKLRAKVRKDLISLSSILNQLWVY